MMIIGLTGSMGCGKGEIVKILENMGFLYVTLSSIVREEAKNRGIEEKRENLMEVGNSMRIEDGAGVLAKRALQKIKNSSHENWVVDGIRNPAEIDELKKQEKTYIVAVEAEFETLVDRIISRERESDPKSRDEIGEKIRRELGEGEPENGQQVKKCVEKSDIIIENNETLEDFEKKFLDYFNSLRKAENSRPSKDEYYLDLAKSVCRRGTCTKVEIGAVIIRGDQVVSTGYCGAPRGTKSSLQHGFCLRQKLGIPSGHRYEMCRSVHAEQNAIINAARSGISLFGGDMYIYGKRPGEDNSEIDAFPCFICKKMIINCGLKRVICSLQNGGMKVFLVDDWVKEWKENDIIDDKFQYGEKTFYKF